jgi:hypothetical protein
MALSETRLENKIVAILNSVKTEEVDADAVVITFAREMAKAMVAEMKEATVTGMCPQNAGALTVGKIN